MTSRWTKELDDDLIARWSRKESGDTIAMALGSTRNAIMGRVRRLREMGHDLPARGSPASLARARRSTPERKEQERVFVASAVTGPIKSLPARGLGVIRPMSDAAPQVGGCRFIQSIDYIAKIKAGQNVFCGKPVTGPGEPWCAEHRAVVFVKSRPG